MTAVRAAVIAGAPHRTPEPKVPAFGRRCEKPVSRPPGNPGYGRAPAAQPRSTPGPPNHLASQKSALSKIVLGPGRGVALWSLTPVDAFLAGRAGEMVHQVWIADLPGRKDAP